MQAKRWQEIDRLFDALLDREPAERASFLAEACAGDEELRREVEALLAAHLRAEKFIETPAMEVAARAAAASDDAFSVLGREIGPYRVLSPLGLGGMGEVYLAEDTRLRRRVALKLLPSEFTHDAERIRRFELEARAASALNHPNIVTIYEIGEIDGAFRAFSWSPDGRKLGGWINAPDEHDGILIFTFETNNFERITDFGSRPIWLHDSRRLLFRDGGKLFLVNSETKKVQEISLHSPNPVIEYGLTADNRTLYYTLLSTEADVWLVNLE